MIASSSLIVERYHVVNEHYGNETRFSVIGPVEVPLALVPKGPND